MGYRPTPLDVRWAREMARILKDGGVFAGRQCPAAVYRINHTDRTVTCVEPSALEDPVAAQVHACNVATFAEIGYTVLPHID